MVRLPPPAAPAEPHAPPPAEVPAVVPPAPAVVPLPAVVPPVLPPVPLPLVPVEPDVPVELPAVEPPVLVEPDVEGPVPDVEGPVPDVEGPVPPGLVPPVVIVEGRSPWLQAAKAKAGTAIKARTADFMDSSSGLAVHGHLRQRHKRSRRSGDVWLSIKPKRSRTLP